MKRVLDGIEVEMTELEIQQLEQSRIVYWDKDAYCEVINELHNQLLNNILAQHNYLSIGELSLWLDDVNYGTEAQAILDWWRLTCDLVEAHCDVVTEQTANDNFVSTLPVPNIGGNTLYSWVTETPVGVVNVVNTTYSTSANFNPAIIDVWVNGILYEKNTDYTLQNGNQIVFTTAQPTGAKIIVSYKQN